MNRAWGHDLTALMWAAGHANDAPKSDGVAAARLLLDAGAKIDNQDDRGRTALMIAAERNHGHMVEILLDAGADSSIRDKNGSTALDLAASEAISTILKR